MSRGDDITKSVDNISQQISPERVRAFFEPQLVSIGLGEEQIKKQNLDELEQSLERVNDAIKNPSAFGTLKMAMTAEIGVMVTKATSDYHIEVGVLPILLQRKKLILDRIRLLKGSKKIEDLQIIAKDVSDEKVRSKLEQEIELLKIETRELREQSSEVEIAQMQEQLNAEIEREKAKSELAAIQAKVELEKFERRSKVWQSYLERESAATVIGGILLMLIGCSLIMSMFLNPIIATWTDQQTVLLNSDILNNAFLLILGYFFGQTVGKATASKSSSEKDDKDQSKIA